MALTGLLSGILSLVIYGFFIASITSETSLEKNLLEKASSTIGSDSHGIANGNSAEAELLAKKYSELITTMQKEFFVREGAEAKIQLSGGKFLTYCQINQEGIAFLVHVPEYRRYEGKAKEINV